MSAGVRALVVTAALAGCRGRSADDRLAADVAAGLERDLGVAPDKVTCAGQGCAAVLGALTVPIAVARDKGETTWQSDEVVLASAVATRVAAELADLGVTGTVDCGPPVQPVPADGRLTCTLPAGGMAWVRLGDGDALAVELALTPAEVAARQVARDEEALERASRALDSDEAEGSEDDDGLDAGVDATIDALPRAPGF